MNENTTPRLVANPNRTQVRTEADFRRSAPPVNPEAESAKPEDR
ncbi:hypothetical protein [Amycolatopsis regifaucium]|nr:hypothetical protein [Amycolatopsis regifaucium]